jgi:Ca2+-dependent lipid-binding protein
MGMNSIPLKELPLDETKVSTVNLLKTMDPNDVQNEKSRGQLTLELTYKPFKEEDMEHEGTEGGDVVEKAPDGTPAGGGLLYVIVHEAQDLEGKHHTNPYAKIIFKGDEKKTKVPTQYAVQAGRLKTMVMVDLTLCFQFIRITR